MNLIDDALLKRFGEVGRQDPDDSGSLLVIAKYFLPGTRWTWYATEYDPKEREFFGYVCGQESEWGYFSQDELEGVKGPHGLPVERDIYFRERQFRQVLGDVV